MVVIGRYELLLFIVLNFGLGVVKKVWVFVLRWNGGLNVLGDELDWGVF